MVFGGKEGYVIIYPELNIRDMLGCIPDRVCNRQSMEM